MPSILTLTGSGESGRRTLGRKSKKKIEKRKTDDLENCRCVMNTRTKRGALLCPVEKTKTHRSGWAFKGKCAG